MFLSNILHSMLFFPKSMFKWTVHEISTTKPKNFVIFILINELKFKLNIFVLDFLTFWQCSIIHVVVKTVLQKLIMIGYFIFSYHS